MNDPPRQLPSSSNAITCISAMPTPSASPPWTWPSTIIGLIRGPQSSTAMNRRTFTCAGARVDVDHADVGAERVGEVGRVVDAGRVQVALHPFGQLQRAVRGERDLLDRLALLRVALDLPAARAPTPGRPATTSSIGRRHDPRLAPGPLRATTAAAAPDTGVEREP